LKWIRRRRAGRLALGGDVNDRGLDRLRELGKGTGLPNGRRRRIRGMRDHAAGESERDAEQQADELSNLHVQRFLL
jgi:hypothetical protein